VDEPSRLKPRPWLNWAALQGQGRLSYALALLSLSLPLLLSAVTLAAPGDRPGVLLEGATIARARALALDAALIKGWQVTESGRAHLIFETRLEQPASIGPPGALPPDQTTLRIRADFIATPAGVNTYLYAEEVWWPGSARQWIGDVTQRYRTNLMNALSSLQRQWTGLARTAADRAGPMTPGPTTARPSPDGVEPKVRVEPAGPSAMTAAAKPIAVERAAQPAPTQTDIEVGTWAYYAEALAVQRGCTLGDMGAELVSAPEGSELHRVHCADNSTLMVRCDRLGCTVAQ